MRRNLARRLRRRARRQLGPQLRRKPNAEKSLALILSDYPARRGRGGYAIGLDTEASVEGDRRGAS